MKGFQKLIPVDQALKTFLAAVPSKKPKTVSVTLTSALNRVLAENVIAKEDLPRFDRSAVDGYAVKARDTTSASQFKPKTLRIVEDRVDSMQAKQVWTGNPIPKGADSVVMLENTEKNKDEVKIWVQLTPGENVSKKGEDLAKGETALRSGIRLKAHHLGLTAALGKTEIKIFEKPSVGVLATGNELAEMGSIPQAYQIFDSNKVMVSSLCRELGAEPVDLGIAKDDVDDIVGRLKRGLKKTDCMITTGGTSVGAADLVPESVNMIGNPGVIVHGVAMRPGMPTALAVVEEKPVMILSGNPVAAIFGFEVFARPLISRMIGLERTELRSVVEARITKRTTAALGRRTFVRVHVSQSEHGFSAAPISAKGSGLISTMTKANGYVVVPENREGLEEGEIVYAYLFDDVEVG
ncbi:MAG TPA: gephyrin-like molybdotransferase Glp [Candidatus Bathyarchaeia archaeon]|jgi:molybdopterin molybdotransferase|nr:gephyrin-like molybdotransferase Glp [Candidatus Bathyarchaeia archaeon]